MALLSPSRTESPPVATHNANCAKPFPVSPDTFNEIEQRYLLSLPSPRSRAAMASCITRLAQLTGGAWHSLDQLAVLRAVRGLDGLSLATQRLHISCLRGLLRAAEADPRVVLAARAPRGESDPAGRALSAAEQDALVAACRTLRDRALVLVTLASGVRVSELVALDVADLADNALLVRSGKGRKQRVVALPDDAVAALTTYVGGREHGPLLCTGEIERLSPRGVQSLLETLSRRANIDHVSPHDLRRTCVTNASAAGASLNAVRLHVGHAQLSTTQRYLRADPLAESRKVAKVLARAPATTR
jgi:integrase